MQGSREERRTPSYEDGKRDGKIEALEQSIQDLTRDVRLLNKAMWMMGGAIAAVNVVIPLVESYYGGG